jgi:hypothetical protein
MIATINNIQSGCEEKNRRDKIDILQTHHRSLPWIGTYTSTNRGVVELESWAQNIHLLLN